MSNLSELYQEMILDHNKSPHNYGSLPDANRSAIGHNPLCGDQMTLYLHVGAEDRIESIAFQGRGCAIFKASASMMTDAVKGKSIDEALSLFRRVHDVMTGPPDVKPDTSGLGKLAVFAGVREFPVRVKCAALSWRALESALSRSEAPAKTE